MIIEKIRTERKVNCMKTKQESIFSSKTLTYFLQLTETMNYTQAAQILGITQPALTQQIKKLERTVGAPLFYSVGKKLKLSDAGYTMLKTTHNIYDLLNEATDEIQQATSANHGEIHLGILASIETQVLEEFAIRYYKANPDIHLTFHMLTRKEIWDGLENNQIDLAIMYLPDDSIKNWKPYDSKKIMSEDLLFIHHDAELEGKKKIKLKKTLDHPWVTYPVVYYLDQMVKEAYKNQMVDQPDIIARFTQPGQIYRFMKETDSYTALPKSYVLSRFDRDTIMTATFEPQIKFNLSFVYRTAKDQIPRIAQFLEEFDGFLEERDYYQRIDDIVKAEQDEAEQK